MRMGEFSLTNRKWVVVMVFWTLLHMILLVWGLESRGSSAGDLRQAATEWWFPFFWPHYDWGRWFVDRVDSNGIGAYDLTEFLVYAVLPWAALWAGWYLRKAKVAK